MTILMRSCSLQGKSHRGMHQKSHDARYIQGDARTQVGVLSDGCGSGAFSESFSQEAAYYWANHLYQEFRTYDTLDRAYLFNNPSKFNDVIAETWIAYVSWLEANLELRGQFRKKMLRDTQYVLEKRRYAEDFMRHTILAYVVLDGHLYLIEKGDGEALVDKKHFDFDYNNQPPYGILASDIFERHMRHDLAKQCPNVQHFGTQWEKAMLCTDGVSEFPVYQSDEFLYPNFNVITDDNLFDSMQVDAVLYYDDGFQPQDDATILVIHKTVEETALQALVYAQRWDGLVTTRRRD